MRHYQQIQASEREEIERGVKEGKSISEIGRMLARDKSTISREVRRNKHCVHRYMATHAAEVAGKRRRVVQPHILRNSDARFYALSKLELGWTPQEIAGRMRVEKLGYYCCAETIYRFIYSAEGREGKLYKHLKRKQKSRFCKHSKRPKESRIPKGQSVHERGKNIDNRRHYGHFEGDLVIGKNGNITTIVERKTRFAFAIKNNTKHTEIVINAIISKLSTLPQRLRQSITFDQGTEFANHQQLQHTIGIKSFFCDPHSPWQKGANENFNGRLRRFFPKGADLANITQIDLDHVIHTMNNTPRKCLGFLSPNEAFQLQLDRCCTSF
jgi:transposase, IS30 family